MKKYLSLLVLIGILFVEPVYAKQGCCSHHGGVSGCSESGRQICNDGTLSPSCTCTPQIKSIYGCTDKNAKNYNSNANKDDGSCKYYIYGCTDIDSINFNSNAEKDDGSCIKKVYGCMDKNAKNYNELANINDDSCEYQINDAKEDNVNIKNKDNINMLQDNKDIKPIPLFITLSCMGGLLAYINNKKQRK